MNMKWLATAASAAVATVVIVPNWGLAGDAVQGCSTLSTYGELKQPINAVESGSISILHE